MATPQMAETRDRPCSKCAVRSVVCVDERASRPMWCKNLIMGTARPLRFVALDDGCAVLPRRQGAGLRTPRRRRPRRCVPTVVLEQSRPKADLGDGTVGIFWDVTLHNPVWHGGDYELSSQALFEIVTVGSSHGAFLGLARPWRGRSRTAWLLRRLIATVTVPARRGVSSVLDDAG